MKKIILISVIVAIIAEILYFAQGGFGGGSISNFLVKFDFLHAVYVSFGRHSSDWTGLRHAVFIPISWGIIVFVLALIYRKVKSSSSVV